MALWVVLSIVLAVGTALGAGGNFGDTPGLNGGDMVSKMGINPVQHSEGAAPPEQLGSPGINPVQHSE